MAQYKVPQDVEADDKLLGPFSFRQFIYLIIVALFGGLAYALFQLFPPLVIIPIPIILVFAALALPLRKDQPMETYLAAVVSYFLKPHKRLWYPGQRESTILITAPKTTEVSRVKNISGEEASTRLSDLANTLDTEGRGALEAIHSSSIRDEFAAEANTVVDMFEIPTPRTSANIASEANSRRAELVSQMKAAIERQNLSRAASDAATSVSRFSLPGHKVIQPLSAAETTTATTPSVIVEPTLTPTPTQPASPTPPPTQQPTPSPTPTPPPAPTIDDKTDEVFVSFR